MTENIKIADNDLDKAVGGYKMPIHIENDHCSECGEIMQSVINDNGQVCKKCATCDTEIVWNMEAEE